MGGCRWSAGCWRRWCRSTCRAALARDAPALLITFRDLSEQDRLARMRADFVANASHELRTPLAYLKGSVETLQGRAKDDAAAREAFLKTMGEQAERMSRLVDDLLSLSRVEMREYLPPSGEVDLAAVLADVAQTLEPHGPAGRRRPCRSSCRTAPALVRGDYDELAQVFQNLVQNAIKYGRERRQGRGAPDARAGGQAPSATGST